MIPVLELEKSGDARFGNSDSRLGTYEKNFGSRTGYKCSLYGFQFDKRARFGDNDSYSRTLQLFLPEFIIKCTPSEGYLTYLFCVCGCCNAEYYINPYEMY